MKELSLNILDIFFCRHELKTFIYFTDADSPAFLFIFGLQFFEILIRVFPVYIENFCRLFNIQRLAPHEHHGLKSRFDRFFTCHLHGNHL